MGRAYSGLAVQYYNIGDEAKGVEYMRLAMTKLDRMNRREKYRTRGIYYMMVRDFAKAAEQFESLLREVPGESIALPNLTLALFISRDFQRAVEVSEQYLADDNQSAIALANLAYYNLFVLNLDRAEQALKQALEVNPEYIHIGYNVALLAAVRGETTTARARFQALRDGRPGGEEFGRSGVGDMMLYHGEYRAAAELYGLFIDGEKATDGDRARYARAKLMLGDTKTAVEVATQLLSKPTYNTTPSMEAALVLVDAGRPEVVAPLVERFRDGVAVDAQQCAALLEAELLRAEGDTSAAVRGFRQALEGIDSWVGRFMLGRALNDAGAHAEAKVELEACRARRGEAIDAYVEDRLTYSYWPPVLFELGRAEEGLGGADAAKKHYQAFLDIRASGDEDSLVRHARERLAALTSVGD
jgi:tetratricopeptide (TPR) repeat protein